MKTFYFSFKTYSLSLLVICLVFTSCKKAENGEPGEKGMPGIQGIAGLDGNSILSGITAPQASTGIEGDFYLNLGTTEFYGPKSSSGWGQPLTLRGVTGDRGLDGADGVNGTDGTDGINGTDGRDGVNGKDGAIILSGSAAPATSQGKEGDFFIDIISAQFYGPKSSFGWGPGINLTKSSFANKVIFMTNCRFSVPANSTRGISTYYFNGYYTQAYDQGGILVYIRETNDPSGKWYNAFDKSNDLLITNPFGSVKVYGDAANSGKLGLTFIAWTQSGQTQAITECRFDQKIILLLPNTLSMMKAANVNSNNMAEVEKFLKRTTLK